MEIDIDENTVTNLPNVRKALPQTHVKIPKVFFRQDDDGTDVRETIISAAYNVHGGIVCFHQSALFMLTDLDGTPNSFKKQLLYLLTPAEQLELAAKKVRVQAVKYVSNHPR